MLLLLLTVKRAENARTSLLKDQDVSPFDLLPPPPIFLFLKPLCGQKDISDDAPVLIRGSPFVISAGHP